VGLEIVGATSAGATAPVVPVTTHIGIRGALKLVSLVGSIDGEASALNAFAGRGAVKLL